MMKIIVALLVSGVLLGGSFVVRAAEGRPVANLILAIVGDTIITREQVIRAAGVDEMTLRRLSPTASTEAVRAEYMRILEQTYRSLIARQLVLQEYRSLEKKGAKVPESFIDQKVREKIAGDRVQFARELEREGRSFEQFRSDLRDDIVYGAMTAQFVPDPIISPNKIEDYYQKHPEKYRVEERVKVRTIYLRKVDGDGGPAVRGRMEDLASLLKAGTDFKELEKSYSEMQARDEQGEPAWREVSSLDESIRSELATLKPGEYSKVVEMPDRYVILRLDQRDAGHAMPLNDVREVIENQLKAEESNRRLDEWFKRLEAKILVKKF